MLRRIQLPRRFAGRVCEVYPTIEVLLYLPGLFSHAVTTPLSIYVPIYASFLTAMFLFRRTFVAALEVSRELRHNELLLWSGETGDL